MLHKSFIFFPHQGKFLVSTEVMRAKLCSLYNPITQLSKKLQTNIFINPPHH